MINTLTNQNSGTLTLTEIGHRVDSFLHRKEITAAILGYYKIVMPHIGCKRRHHLRN
ncbi:hypothetical protein EVA_08972 [gut metagenome]|uniref:Uncharacterized protein n=1 Tax=gut metagenome TaxID=749906 RepID=J9G6P0_9ZZZZ